LKEQDCFESLRSFEVSQENRNNHEGLEIKINLYAHDLKREHKRYARNEQHIDHFMHETCYISMHTCKQPLDHFKIDVKKENNNNNNIWKVNLMKHGQQEMWSAICRKFTFN
jgi:hypothetical protein